MPEHLTDEQLVEHLSGGADAATREHLAACPACRAEHESLRMVLAQYAETTRAAAVQPEGFWQAQQAAITRRWTRPPAPRRLAWAAAAASVVLAATLLIKIAQQPEPVAEADPDQALLVEVERSVRRELPRALEPAALLAEEVSRSTETRSNP